jgi:hypothetical protein
MVATGKMQAARFEAQNYELDVRLQKLSLVCGTVA